MRIRTAAAAAVAALLCTPLAACGSDSDGDKPAARGKNSNSSAPGGATDADDAEGDTTDDSNGSGDESAALKRSVRSYTKALFGGDPNGHDLLSKRCQSELSKEQFATMAKQAKNDYGTLTIKTISVDQISGDMARVSYGVGVPQFERKAQPWTREGSTWHWDAC
ncbi:hypothetical protein [Streptomyces zagrosensis]|uniref:Lipoprotein n=1 Tax=Streptomyces zagrosensis TaxID=1042984 RepID=A0A7W9Q7M9_9ACTN|nr:hypothetical protein [Streptomyces zagrosensis]MBB5935016.1 hypothetical protein [Streptomyces zagrosensis]